MTRKIALVFTGLALLLVIAGPANAATTQVKLRTQATGVKLMTRDANSLVSMKDPGAANQIWTRTDTSGGYATYAQGNVCLTGRSLQGLPLVTAQKCVPGATNQQWRLGVSKELQLRLNGLVAEVKTASASLQVQMAFFQVKPNQRWIQLAA
jgi:hypothetical protein